jgi:hypothetical protein
VGWKCNFGKSRRATNLVPPDTVPTQEGSESGGLMEEGGLEAPREDLNPHIGQGEGMFHLFVRSCAGLILA